MRKDVTFADLIKDRAEDIRAQYRLRHAHETEDDGLLQFLQAVEDLADHVRILEGQTESHEQRLDATAAAYKDHLALVERVKALEASRAARFDDNCASMVPEKCQECAIGESECDLRARVVQFVEWVRSNSRPGSFVYFSELIVKLRKLGLLD